MKMRRVSVVLGLLALAAAGVSFGAGFNMEPFSSSWQMEQPARKVDVKSTVEHTFYFDTISKKLSDKPQDNVKYVYKNGVVVQEISLLADGAEQPRTAIDVDGSGRRTKVTTEIRMGQPDGQAPKIMHNIETAELDAKGVIKSFTILKEAQPPAVPVDVQEEATPDGGRKLTCKVTPPMGRGGPAPAAGTGPAPDNSITIVFIYDKTGNLVSREMLRGGSSMMKGAYTYNEKNDISEISTGSGKQVYEYEYDAKGNWTKRTYLTVNKQQDGTERKDVQNVITRDITY